MDSSKPRKSDAAATRKRRSSILKSQRNVRAPLSELEFNVTTPDQAKSRRVSFSRRTGVAEFEIDEATTAWKNVYEEHNKSLDASANESGVKAAPRRVSHLGGRASHFEDEEADISDDGDVPAPSTAQLEPPTSINTLQFFQMDGNPCLRQATENLDVDFSAMAPLALTDDLDLLQQDLDLERDPTRDNCDEFSIDVDFNATHFSLKADDDDMSITDTIRNPAVAVTEKSQVDLLVAVTKSQVDDWTVDKENILINPYVAPPPAEFPCEDDILVFDGKKCKFQSKLDISEARNTGDVTDRVILPVNDENIPPNHKTMFLDDMTETRAIPGQILQNISHVNPQRTVVFGDGDISITQAVGTNIIEPEIIRDDKDNHKTMYFNDLADMSVTQALPADIIQNVPHHSRTIVYGDNGHISMTQPVSTETLLPAPIEKNCLANIEDTRRKTIVCENENVAITGVVTGNICFDVNEALNTDRRKTIVYGNDDGNVSMTGVVPANIIDELKIEQPSTDRRKTIVYGNDDGNVSMTGVVPANIIDEVKIEQPNTDRRKTIVYGNDGNVSMTGVVPSNVMDAVRTEQPSTERRKTIVYGNDDGNVSMTGVVPSNVMDAVKTEQSSTDRRKTIVYGNDDGNVSMTGVVPSNVMDAVKTEKPNTDRRKTIVYGNDGNVSMTGVVPSNVMDAVRTEQPSTERRKTIVYGNDDGNVSMTGVVPSNVMDAVRTEQPSTDRRKTIVYGNDDGNVSMTGVVPSNVMDAVRTEQPSTDRRKTIVYGNDDGNVSMTGVVPSNVMDAVKTEQPSTGQRKTIVYGNDNVSITGVVAANIIDEVKTEQPSTDRRKTIVYGNDDGNVSMTGVVPVNIIDEVRIEQPSTDRRKTIVYGNDDGNVSMTGVVPSNVMNAVKTEQPSTGRRKTIVYGDDDGNVSMTGVVPANIIDENDLKQQTNRRQTVVFDEDGDLSMTGIASVNILEAQQPNGRRTTIVYGDDGNISITGVVPVNIVDAVAQQPNIDRRETVNEDGNTLDGKVEQQPHRRTVVFENDNGDLSMTGVAPINILEAKAQEPNKDYGKIIIYGNDNGNVSSSNVKVDQQPNIDRRTVVFGNNDGDLSITSVAPVNILDAAKPDQPNMDRRETIVYDNNDGNVSITGVLPANVLDHAPTSQQTNINRRTVVFENDDGNLSMTGIAPLDGTKVQEPHTELIKSVVYGNDDNNISITGVVPVKIHDEAKGSTRRTTIVDADAGNMSMNHVLPSEILNQDVNALNVEHGKTSVYYNELSMTAVAPVNTFDEKKQNIAHTNKSIVFENVTKQIEQRNENVVFGDNNDNMSTTEILPGNTIEDKAQRSFTNVRLKTIDDENEGGNVSIAGIVPGNVIAENNVKQPNQSVIGALLANMIHQEHYDVITRTNTDNRITIVNNNLSAVGAVPANIYEDEKLTQSPPKTVVYEDNDVSMTGIAAHIMPGDTNVIVPETFNSIVCENTETHDNIRENFEEKDEPVKMIEDVTIPKLVESDEDADVYMQAVSDPESPKGSRSTFNKSLAGQCTTFDKSLADQNCDAFEKSLTNQVCSTTFNKSSAGHALSTTFNKSSAFNKSSTINKTLTNQEHSTAMNKSNNVLVYGATTKVNNKNMTSYIDGLDQEGNQSEESKDNDSLALSKSSADRLPDGRSPTQSIEHKSLPATYSVLDTLLDMSRASVEFTNDCQSKTKSPTVSNTTLTNKESYILIKDDEEVQDSELPTLKANKPVAKENKKHGIVCKLQRKLSELKNIIHVKERSPKKEKTVTTKEQQDLLPIRQKSSLRQSTSPEKNKSVKIDLTSRLSVDDDDQQDNHTQVDLIYKNEQNNDKTDIIKCQANDTRAILDALSDLAATRRSGDFELIPSPDKTRRSSAPDRKSMLIAKDDLLREISMAQALMITEKQQTETETEGTEDSSDDQESPHRLSGEVVKTLRFEDDDSILESKILQKPSFASGSPRRMSSVIPPYEISDSVKELVNDLIKPLADVPQPLSSTASESCQVSPLDSSQIDLIPSQPVFISPRSCLRQTQHSTPLTKTHEKRNEPAVILFDQLYPLNNVLLPPVDHVVVHKYNPQRSEESIVQSADSQCCQTNSEPSKDVDVGMVLVGSPVDRAVAHERSVRDSGVNTSIVMKANRELLAASSSLTLVDDAFSTTDDVQIRAPLRSPVRVIFQLDDAASSVRLGAELTSDASAEPARGRGRKGSESEPEPISDASSDRRKKRGHVASKGPETTPKPASKVQKVSKSAKARKRSATPSDKDSSVSGDRGSSVTVAQLHACARSVTSTTGSESLGSRVSIWRPDLIHEPSSKNLLSEQQSGVNVVAKIDVLPFMGTSECEWESRAADTWSFRLLRARLRLLVRLEHRATNTARVLVRADTPVRLVLVQHATLDQERSDPVAAMCLSLAADTLQHMSSRGVTRAGQVPALLRRCAAVVRVALRWGRTMRAAHVALAFSLQDTGDLSLKVANIPLRSVWEVTFRIELAERGGTPHPRAADLKVTRVVAAWTPSSHELQGMLDTIPEDWGHVPRTIWKIFKYLKHKKPEDDLLSA